MKINYKGIRNIYSEEEINKMCIETVMNNIASLLKMDYRPSVEIIDNYDLYGSHNYYYKRIKIKKGCFDITGYLGYIYVGRKEDALKSLAKGINTLCHELRHGWQHEYGLYDSIDYISCSDKSLVEKYGKEVVREMYEAQPSEIDANYWAEKKGNQLLSGELTPETILKDCFFMEEQWLMED